MSRFGLFICGHKIQVVDQATIEAVCDELRTVLPGRRPGKIFTLAPRQLAWDLRLRDHQYLFIGTEPNAPRLYLIKRRFKDLEKQASNPHPFHLVLKKHLSGLEVLSLEKIANERIVRMEFAGESESGTPVRHSLMIQLTGKSSNLFLLDDRDRIIASLTASDHDGQRPGEEYSPPQRPTGGLKDNSESLIECTDGESVSEALDHYYTNLESESRLRARAGAEIKKIRSELSRRRKLTERLNTDLASHGDADRWKRFGDLILANLSTARRQGDKVLVTDFFDDTAPTIEIEADENLPLTQTAERYFKRYNKAQNAAREIDERLKTLRAEIGDLDLRLAEAEKAAAEGDAGYFEESEPKPGQRKPKKADKHGFNGARQFMSSDGFQILVGKRAVDNDQLTFRVAGSLDLWLHAADYPGSHVVVRNPNRKEIPLKTLLEAAQLAAFYSSGKSQPKAAVHYTQKKFVNKPKGAAPGLVRLASFKTILVEPVIPPAIDKK